LSSNLFIAGAGHPRRDAQSWFPPAGETFKEGGFKAIRKIKPKSLYKAPCVKVGSKPTQKLYSAE